MSYFYFKDLTKKSKDKKSPIVEKLGNMGLPIAGYIVEKSRRVCRETKDWVQSYIVRQGFKVNKDFEIHRVRR